MNTINNAFVDEEWIKAEEKGKTEFNQDYILTDYPGIILRTYKPSIAALMHKRGLHMKKFHPEKRIVQTEKNKATKRKIPHYNGSVNFY